MPTPDAPGEKQHDCACQRPGQIKLFCQEVFACISTLPGYWAAGFACGAIGRVSGFDTVEIALLSIFLYAGSAHFLFYSLTAAGTGIGQIAIAFINIRYLLIGTCMAQFFIRSSLTEKLISGLLTTDETFGCLALCQPSGRGSALFLTARA